MNLSNKIDQLMQGGQPTNNSIEELILEFSLADKYSLIDACDYGVEKYGIQLPIWVMILGFRLSIGKTKDDLALRKKASQMIETYGGPDFESIVNKF